MTFRPRRGRVGVHRGRDTVRGEDHRGAGRHVLLGADEDRPATRQLGHDVSVVDDLLAHVDGRATGEIEGALDGLDRTVDAGAVAARRGEQETRWCHAGSVSGAVARPATEAPEPIH